MQRDAITLTAGTVEEDGSEFYGTDANGIRWLISLPHSGFGWDAVRAFCRDLVDHLPAVIEPVYDEEADRWYVHRGNYGIPLSRFTFEVIS